eukprot:910612-Amorphochlora_amoeboformis.AAC.1
MSIQSVSVQSTRASPGFERRSRRCEFQHFLGVVLFTQNYPEAFLLTQHDFKLLFPNGPCERAAYMF